MNDWKPIETAPKGEDVDILVRLREKGMTLYRVVYWNSRFGQWHISGTEDAFDAPWEWQHLPHNEWQPKDTEDAVDTTVRYGENGWEQPKSRLIIVDSENEWQPRSTAPPDMHYDCSKDGKDQWKPKTLAVDILIRFREKDRILYRVACWNDYSNRWRISGSVNNVFKPRYMPKDFSDRLDDDLDALFSGLVDEYDIGFRGYGQHDITKEFVQSGVFIRIGREWQEIRRIDGRPLGEYDTPWEWQCLPK